ncbi:MAG TPA: hypothetical protein PKD85_22715 [Saprospiraceae bacterium]|nr:hypothetical protein [Saprospiraceae bacterium]
MRLQCFKIGIIVFLSVMIFACKDNNDVCSIEGKWYFHQVNRNYKPTNTLEGGYFDFKDEKVFTSNIFDENQEYSYTFTYPKIEINTEENLKFTIVQCSKDTLILAGEISAFYMNFLMTKNPIESLEEDSNYIDSDLQ